MLYDPRHDLDDAGKILWAAADDLEEIGWCQGTLVDRAGRLCVVGALKRHERDDNKRALWEARRRLAEYVGVSILPCWNDALGRTKEEVIAACRGAATRSPEGHRGGLWRCFEGSPPL
jgi:hypothetical protein